MHCNFCEDETSLLRDGMIVGVEIPSEMCSDSFVLTPGSWSLGAALRVHTEETLSDTLLLLPLSCPSRSSTGPDTY